MFAASKTSRRAVAGATNDSNIANVSLLLHGDGTNGGQNQTFIDGANGYTTTRYGNVSQGSFSPFRSADWSNYFDGSSYLTAPNINFGTSNFTMEGWFYLTTALGSNTTLFSLDNGVGANPKFIVFLSTTSISIQTASATSVVATHNGFPTNAWNHVAVVRTSTGAGGIKIYLNGVGLTNTSSSAIGDMSGITSPVYIGFDGESWGAKWTGYISNVRMTSGVALYTTNFTRPALPFDTTANTTLLTCASNTFEDLSGSSKAITLSGSVRVTPFSPFGPTTRLPKSYSMYFDGNGDFLSTTTAPNLTGDFTIECWVFQTVQNTFEMICGSGPNYWAIGATNNFEVGIGASPTYPTFTSGSAFPLNRWVHVALCRSGTSLRGFIDGVQIGSTVTNSNAFFPTGSFYIGQQGQANYYYYHGSISNFRIVKGTALYTANFTPPTSQLVNGVGDVTLLTCQSYLPFDNSAYGTIGSVTANGNAQPTKANPFGYTLTATTGYDSATMGASAYFDGTTDSVEFTVFGQPGYNFAGDFRMEAWVYPTMDDASGYSVLFSSSSANNQLYFDAGDGGMGLTIGATNVIAKTGTAVKVNAWNHLMWTRNGSTCRMFCNGTLIGTGTSSASLNISAVGYFAYSGGYDVNGYVAGVRLMTDNNLLTQQFTPLLTPTQWISNTQYLLTMDNASIIDHSQNVVIETVGNAQVSTSVKKYGTGSIYFDGSGDSLDLKFPTADAFSQKGAYTIEAWIYPTNLSVAQYFYSQNTTNFLQFAISSSGFLQVDRSGVGVAITSSSALTINTWQHVALVSDGTNLKLYVNGTQSGSTVAVGTQADPTSAIIRIGAYQNSGGAPSLPFYGYIDEFRITKGVARYVANFTPPTAAFSNI